MEHYCAECGQYRILDRETFWCEECLAEWHEKEETASARRGTEFTDQ